ncbi:acetyl-CoA carboxylase biotin carboxyl carrier protein subunit [Cyclobacterium sp.]|uniref:acetyl-CoA carboxylase biotin carboxyl carrier protein subunit n=1 Tax=Cyclobacterium sp. TaxID=1966343 RepID=UPI0019CD1B27|nr:acetyl-CoA carboxylase biotin carboxyl carrier protein subunit [Cyclobacterium sp.]MBD3630103.1 acetyl-CoA carboxylase biotin carboxyl carrier protein subunit [Cyclobacterium sp.]
MTLIKLNDQSFTIKRVGEHYQIGEKKIKAIVHQKGENEFLIEYNHRMHHLILLDKTVQDEYHLSLNGIACWASRKNAKAQLLEKLGMQENTALKISSVSAPMPGMVLEIKVKAGDRVEKNDVLMVLEAMKMENTIKSPASGTINSIDVKEGEGVEKNQVLLQF